MMEGSTETFEVAGIVANCYNLHKIDGEKRTPVAIPIDMLDLLDVDRLKEIAAMTIHKRQLKPGDLWFDREGKWSGNVPMTYLILSAMEMYNTKMEYKVARFMHVSNGWAGAPIQAMWEEDFQHMEWVGTLQSDHLE